MAPEAHPFGVHGMVEMPENVRAWAWEWAPLVLEINDESLYLSGGHRRDTGMPLALYGGQSPIVSHVDRTVEELDGEPNTPVWGLILACPQCRLVWDEGSAPLTPGSVYRIDPLRRHAVEGESGPISFLANFDRDPRTLFADASSFGLYALEIAIALHRSEPDPIRFVERQTGASPGEYS